MLDDHSGEEDVLHEAHHLLPESRSRRDAGGGHPAIIARVDQ